MDTSVTINGVSYNGAHALTLGKEDWVKEVSADFCGDTTKAGEAYDSIAKELDARKSEEQKDRDAAAKSEALRAEAQKKLDARGKKPVAAEVKK